MDYSQCSLAYSDISQTLTKQLPKTVKQSNGIYFTPPECVITNIKLLEPYLSLQQYNTILEPSCGSCEYITTLNKLYPGKYKIHGIEFNDVIFQAIQHIANDNTQLYNMDYLTYKPTIKYDLIIGNPPYYVLKKSQVNTYYYKYFTGRPNIFILFIIKSLELLNDNGILSFVLPKSFLNCLYYNNTRQHINDNFKILNIVECSNDNNKYIETEQDTIILIIQKQINTLPGSINNKIHNSQYILYTNNMITDTTAITALTDTTAITAITDNNDIIELSKSSNIYCIFTTHINNIKIKDLYKNSKSLAMLGFKVSVGTVVWNQCKTILTDDSNSTRLIYSSDIINNNLSIKKYSNITKKNYINKPGLTKPIIVINRGYGVGQYKLDFCLININSNVNENLNLSQNTQNPQNTIKQYLIENHLICIEYTGLGLGLGLGLDLHTQSTTQAHNNDNDNDNHNDNDNILLQIYNKIILSLQDARTLSFINLYFGNNAINTTELLHILPIYQDINV